MRNVLLAIGTFVASFALLVGLCHWHTLGAVLIALSLALIAQIILARQSFLALEAIFKSSQELLQPPQPRCDLAIAKLQQGYILVKHQFGIKGQINSQIGMLYFLQREFAKASHTLSKGGLLMPWLSYCMLTVCYYKKKDFTKLKKSLTALKVRCRKQPVAIGLQAYLWQQLGDNNQALQILHDGVQRNPSDHRLKELLSALENGKKMKMRVFGEMWYQFQIERPQREIVRQVSQANGAGYQRQAVRNRW